jgi:NAD(P)-dependent dehydrogenase (short-subunit alcohol dehydrogenase family)
MNFIFLPEKRMLKNLKKLGLKKGILKDKIAIVTGAGQGLGADTARGLGLLGAKVVIADISDAGLKVQKEIITKGGDALFMQTDISDSDSVKELAESILLTSGRVDILVNNAAIIPFGSFLEQSIDKFDDVYRNNLRGTVLMTRMFLPSMLLRKEGVIVNMVTSDIIPYAAAYAAASAAVRAFTLSLAEETGEKSGVSIYAFAPGFTDTPGCTDLCQKLASAYDMSYEQYITHLKNPGYKNLVPSAECAAGLIYTIINHLDYHAHIADPFHPLDKAGIITVDSELTAVPEAKPKAEKSSKSAKIDGTPDEALALTRELEKQLFDLNRELNELGSFKRMREKMNFKSRAGTSLDDWIDTSQELGDILERYREAEHSKEVGVQNLILEKFPWLVKILERLAEYFQSNIDKLKQEIKNPVKAELAAQNLRHREDTVRSLIIALEKIASR